MAGGSAGTGIKGALAGIPDILHPGEALLSLYHESGSERATRLLRASTRHSYATHLVERGTPLHVVKELLGHEHINTTQVYLHVAQNRWDGVYDPLKDL